MSTDEDVTKELIETLEDGREGFAQGADKLAKDDEPELAATFRRFSEQRASFSAELRELAKDYGDSIKESGTFAATLHRGWMSLKDAVAGSDPKGVLSAAAQGEDHAVKEYEKGLQQDISAGLRTVAERQLTAVRAAQQEIRSLSDARS
jgi:uncharacterized protein (TIGR02284 family)